MNMVNMKIIGPAPVWVRLPLLFVIFWVEESLKTIGDKKKEYGVTYLKQFNYVWRGGVK